MILGRFKSVGRGYINIVNILFVVIIPYSPVTIFLPFSNCDLIVATRSDYNPLNSYLTFITEE